MRIGIFNDSQITTKTVKNFIADLGYEAVSIASSKLDNYSEQDLNRIDVLVMPQYVEKSFLREVIKENPEIMIIFIKNDGSTMTAEEALANRVFAFLSKPIRFYELEVVLARLAQFHANSA